MDLLRLILDTRVVSRGIDARFLPTCPRLVPATVLQSSLPIQNWSSCSPTWTSQRAPAWCLPTETCCQDTQTTPLAPTRRETQSSPLRSAVIAGRGGAAGRPKRSAGVAMSRDWCGRTVL